MALALVGFEEVGLVGLHDPVQVGRLDLGREGEETVAPAKGCVLMQTAAACRCAHALPIDEGLGILAPALAVSQPRQRRPGQCVERLAASGAAKPWQAMCLPPRPTDRMLAMRAGPVGIEDYSQGIRCRPALLSQCFDSPLALRRCQLIGLRQPIAGVRGIHGVNLHVSNRYRNDSWRQHLTQAWPPVWGCG